MVCVLVVCIRAPLFEGRVDSPLEDANLHPNVRAQKVLFVNFFRREKKDHLDPNHITDISSMDSSAIERKISKISPMSCI